MRGARITGIAAERPRRVMYNTELPDHLDTNDEWIQTRTGIVARGIASDDETLVDLCAGAAAKAISDAGISPGDVGLTITATVTNPVPIPAIAPQVTHQLSIPGGAFDINAACAGFCYSISLAADTVRAGNADHVLVVGGDRLSDRTDWNDRNTCVIFGDGAGAAVVSATDSVEDDGIGPVVWGADGSHAKDIEVPVGGQYIYMNGQTVFKWAIAEITKSALEACHKAGIEPAELDAFVPHQANLRIVESVARGLKLPDSVAIGDDIKMSGNTSAASIPMAISRMKEQGRIKTGDKTLIIGFGAGLVWAGQVIECP